MIGYPRRLIVDHVLTPQGDPDRGELRALLDVSSVELDVVAQSLDLMAVTSRPVSEEIGGGMIVRHAISCAVVVQHGDLAEAERIRDAITLDVVMRFRAAWADMVNDTAGADGQTLAGHGWEVDYRPLRRFAGTTETATVVFTLDTDVPG